MAIHLEKLKEMYDFKYVDENEIITCIKTMSKLAENRKIYAEKMFLMNIKKSLIYPQAKTDEKILIQGIVDVLLEGEKDLILVDYKTTKGGAKYLTEKYKTQIDLYTIALEKHYKKPVKKRYIYSFFRNKLIEI